MSKFFQITPFKKFGVNKQSNRRLNSNLFRSLRKFSSGEEDLVIIGGGPGGYACAIKAAQLGLKTTCVEGRGKLGGTCLNIGCIPSKALLNNTHKFHEAQHDFKKRGILVDNVRMDLKTLMKSKSDAVDGLTGGVEHLFKKNKVTYAKGWGTIISPNQVQVKNDKDPKQNRTIQAKNIVIATGSDSANLPGIEVDEKDIVTSTGALDFTSVPKSLVVIGGGVIGLELGSVWARLGSEVTVVEFLPRITPGVDLAIAKKFQQILTKQKLKFKLNTAVKTVKKVSPGKIEVSVESKGNTEKLECEKVLVSVGRVPYFKNLGLENVGIEMDGRVVKTDNHWKTNVNGIYAIGDAIKGQMLAHKAEEEGIAVAEIISGKPGHVNYNAIPGVIYTYPEVACVGLTEEDCKEQNIAYSKGEFPFLANSRARCNQDAEGLVKIIVDKKSDKILGAHIIGPNAGEMIAEAVIGIEYGASSEDLGRTCHAHPTLSEAFKEACMSTYGKPIHF